LRARAISSTREGRAAAMKRRNQGNAFGTCPQRSFKGDVGSNSIFGTFFSTPGSAKGTHEAVPKLPELPKEAFMPGSPLSTSRTVKPSR
jgi:hypothetical protein